MFVVGTGATIALSGCGQAAPVTSPQGVANPPPQSASSPTVTKPSARHASAPARRAPRRHAGPVNGAPGLVDSTASAFTVQPQPPPGSCHGIGSGVYSRPDPRCTPGALNPSVTQATIGQTICQAGWASTVRPPEGITEPEKAASMAAYGDTGAMSVYEYDHFVPLELGGAVNDPRNLWPQPGTSPNPKDTVEDELRSEVCAGQITLAQAQNAITTNWVALASRAPAAAPGAPGRCTLSASYNSRYHDYDVYVQSNEPGQTVRVTDAAGQSASWHADSSGSAEVYFHASVNAAGTSITAHVGGAVCRGRL